MGKYCILFMQPRALRLYVFYYTLLDCCEQFVKTNANI